MINRTKERIIQVSAAMFAKKGCKSITMDDIANAMGISKRTIYENFSDKKDLLTQSMEYFFQYRKDMINNVLQSSQNVIEALFQSTQSHSNFMKDIKFDFFEEIQKYFPEVHALTIQKFRDENIEFSVKMLKKGQADGVFRKEVDMELTATLLQVVNNMILTQEMFATYNYNKFLLSANFNYHFVRGIATEKGLKILDQYLDLFIENTKKYA
jgi:AcrR family transcriptional regulator